MRFAGRLPKLVAMRQRINWLALHGVVRGLTFIGARRGDPQGRLFADPAVRANPTAFIEELRSAGRIVKGRTLFITVDHEIAHEVLRSDDFQVTEIGEGLPKPLRWIQARTDPGLLHPLRPPSLLSVEPPEHTRYRKLVSSVFTSRAVAKLRDRVEETANVLLDGLGENPGVVDIVERYCSRLPVTVIGDILGVPDRDRPKILEYGELGAPSLDLGLTWQQYLRVHRGIEGFNVWLANSSAAAAPQPRRRPDESADRGCRRGWQAQ